MSSRTLPHLETLEPSPPQQDPTKPHIGLPNSKHQWDVGRAPWYGDQRKPFVIGVTGGSASGKTSVCQAIVSALNLPWVGLLSMDRYYKVLSPAEIEVCKKGLYNFDHPDAFDVDQLHEDLCQLRQGKEVMVPNYDFVTHSRFPQMDRMYGVDIIIVEGILLFYSPKILELLDLKIYVDTDNDLRLSRRIKRDIIERGRSVENVLEQYQRTVKPSFEQFIEPTKRFADLIVPWNDTNRPAIDLLTQHIATKLQERRQVPISTPKNIIQPEKKPYLTTTQPTNQTSVLINSPALGAIDAQNKDDLASLSLDGTGSPSLLPPRDKLAGFAQLSENISDSPHPLYSNNSLSASITAAENYRTHYVEYMRSLHNDTLENLCIHKKKESPKQRENQRTTMLYPECLPNNLLLLPPTKSMIAIHTTLRDKETDVDAFRFVLSRLVRILSSEAMNLVSYKPTTIVTPTAEEFHGLQCNPNEMVAVSIVRAGEAFEHPVRDVIKDISIGKIVIQHNVDGNDKKTGPRLYYARLPPVQNRKVLLFDGVLSTGSAVIMAIHVLLDHGVLAENIIFCCLAAAPEGIYAVTSIFPQVTIITSALEQGVDEFLHAVPGVAYVADRWYGTMKSTTVPKHSLPTLDKDTIQKLDAEHRFVSIDQKEIEVIPLDGDQA